jgi:hypothetical protein
MPIDRAELDGHFILNNRVSVVPISSGRAVSADDIFQYLRTNGTSAFSVSVPSCSEVALPIGSTFTLRQAGTGQVTFVAGSGVSIAVRTSGTLMTARQHAVVTLTKVAADTWDLNGEVSIT